MKDSARRPVILIVEDELLIRLDAIEMIEAAGFDTLEAGNAGPYVGPSRNALPYRVAAAGTLSIPRR